MLDPDDLPRGRARDRQRARGALHPLLTVAALAVAVLALGVALFLYNCPWFD